MRLSNFVRKTLQETTLYFTTESWYKVTMNRGFLRLLLLAFLAVTMPMKGIASVTMLGCLTHSDAAQGHGVEDHSHVGHSHHEQPQSADMAVEPQDASPSHGSQGDQKTKCGTCAPCCAGAALTTVREPAVADLPRLADFPAFATPHPSGRINRLDRPPRFPAA